MNPIGSLKLNQRNSAIVAFYLDKDEGYGFFMHENGVFQYFNFDNNAQYYQRAVDNKNQFVQKDFKGKSAIISWHYNYEGRTLTFIDADQKIWNLVVDENLSYVEDFRLKQALDLGQ